MMRRGHQWAAGQDDVVSEGRAAQSYCDWCYGQLTSAAVEASERIGLADEYAWACERCLTSTAYREPPGGWDEDEVWPFRTWDSEAGTGQPSWWSQASWRRAAPAACIGSWRV